MDQPSKDPWLLSDSIFNSDSNTSLEEKEVEYPPELSWLIESAKRQGASIISVDYLENCGFNGTGRANVTVERADGKRISNSGSGRVVDGKFEFFARLSVPV